MALEKIIVTDIIMAGSLFTDKGWDADRSAENLADLKGQVIVDFLGEKFPGVEIYADIAIQAEAGESRPLEVLLYFGENESFPRQSAELSEELGRKVAAATAGKTWAVKAG